MADAESNNNDDLDPKPAAGNRMGWVEVGGWPEAVLDVPPTSNGTKDNPQWLLVGNVPTREEYAAALGTESYSWAAKTVRAPATADVPEHYEQYLQWVPPHVSVPDGYQGYYARSFPVDGFYAAQEQEIAPQSPEPPHLEGWAGQRSVATVSPLLDDRLITQGWMQDDGRFHYTEDLPAQLSIRDNEDVELTGLANSSLILRIGEPPEIGQRGSWLVGKRLDSPNVSFYRVYATFIPEERLTSDYVQEQARQAAFTVAEVVPIGFLPPSSTFPRPETTWAAVPAIPVEQIGAQIPAPQPVELPVVGQRVVAPEPARADDDGPLLDGPVSLAWQRDGTSFYPVSDPAVIGTGNDIGNGGVEDIGLNRSSLVLNVGETPAVGTPGVWLLGKRLEGPDANDERVVARFIPGEPDEVTEERLQHIAGRMGLTVAQGIDPIYLPTYGFQGPKLVGYEPAVPGVIHVHRPPVARTPANDGPSGPEMQQRNPVATSPAPSPVDDDTPPLGMPVVGSSTQPPPQPAPSSADVITPAFGLDPDRTPPFGTPVVGSSTAAATPISSPPAPFSDADLARYLGDPAVARGWTTRRQYWGGPEDPGTWNANLANAPVGPGLVYNQLLGDVPSEQQVNAGRGGYRQLSDSADVRTYVWVDDASAHTGVVLPPDQFPLDHYPQDPTRDNAIPTYNPPDHGVLGQGNPGWVVCSGSGLQSVNDVDAVTIDPAQLLVAVLQLQGPLPRPEELQPGTHGKWFIEENPYASKVTVQWIEDARTDPRVQPPLPHDAELIDADQLPIDGFDPRIARTVDPQLYVRNQAGEPNLRGRGWVDYDNGDREVIEDLGTALVDEQGGRRTFARATVLGNNILPRDDEVFGPGKWAVVERSPQVSSATWRPRVTLEDEANERAGAHQLVDAGHFRIDGFDPLGGPRNVETPRLRAGLGSNQPQPGFLCESVPGGPPIITAQDDLNAVSYARTPDEILINGGVPTNEQVQAGGVWLAMAFGADPSRPDFFVAEWHDRVPKRPLEQNEQLWAPNALPVHEFGPSVDRLTPPLPMEFWQPAPVTPTPAPADPDASTVIIPPAQNNPYDPLLQRPANGPGSGHASRLGNGPDSRYFKTERQAHDASYRGHRENRTRDRGGLFARLAHRLDGVAHKLKDQERPPTPDYAEIYGTRTPLKPPPSVSPDILQPTPSTPPSSRPRTPISPGPDFFGP